MDPPPELSHTPESGDGGGGGGGNGGGGSRGGGSVGGSRGRGSHGGGGSGSATKRSQRTAPSHDPGSASTGTTQGQRKRQDAPIGTWKSGGTVTATYWLNNDAVEFLGGLCLQFGAQLSGICFPCLYRIILCVVGDRTLDVRVLQMRQLLNSALAPKITCLAILHHIFTSHMCHASQIEAVINK